MKILNKLIKSLSTMAISFSVVTTPLAVSASSLPFADVPANAWYAQDALDCYANGIFKGKNETTFAPSDSLKISEAIALSARIHAKRHNTEIPVSGSVWYEPYIQYARENKLLDESKNFESRLNEYATRTEMVHILYPSSNQSEYAIINNIQDDSIPDVMSGSKTGDEIYTFYRAGIVNGIANTHYFKPGREIQRAEVAAIVNRILNPARRTSLSLTLKPVPDLYAPITEENIHALLDGLDPNGAYIINHSREQQDITTLSSLLSWFEGKQKILDNIQVAVHEEEHGFTLLDPDFNTQTWKWIFTDRYYTGAQDSIKVPYTDVYNTTEMYASIDPAVKESPRVQEYSGTESNDFIASKVYGVYGLMNEWNAYCWDLNNCLRCIHYQKEEHYQDGASCLAYAEFKFMILHYLWYAQQAHPDIYSIIMNNAQFKKAFNIIDNNYRTTIEDLLERPEIELLDMDIYNTIMQKLKEPQYTSIEMQLY